MKITLTDVKSGYNLTPLNTNFEAIEKELQNKVLYRNNPAGEPNQMEGPLDLNQNNIMNVGQLDVRTFKIQGEDSTQFLDESVTEAFNWAQYPEDTPVPEGTGSQFSSFHYSLKAADSATAAQAAETDAELALFNFNGTWYGTLASEPIVDPNGNAPTDGDIYLNSTTGVVNFFLSGTWNPLGGGNVTSVHGRTGAVVSQSGDYTATEITYDNSTSGLTATETQSAIDELSSEKEDSANLGTASTKDFGTTTGTLPETTYQEVTINTGDFSSSPFTLYCLKLGNVVTLSWGVATHTSGSTANSGSGAVPAAFLPSSTSANIYSMTADCLSTANISSAGIIAFSYRDWAGADFVRTDNVAPGSMSYIV